MESGLLSIVIALRTGRVAVRVPNLVGTEICFLFSTTPRLWDTSHVLADRYRQLILWIQGGRMWKSTSIECQSEIHAAHTFPYSIRLTIWRIIQRREIFTFYVYGSRIRRNHTVFTVQAQSTLSTRGNVRVLEHVLALRTRQLTRFATKETACSSSREFDSRSFTITLFIDVF